MLPEWELIVRLVAAAALGSIIGAERERLLWAAGLRTHMLVCVGSCLFMIVSSFGFADILGADNVILDPSRVAAQVVSGIGFLGAGSILLRGEIVRGLTTAASLWTVAAIGLAVGGGLYVAAGASTFIILVILAGIKPLEEYYRRRMRSLSIRLRCERGGMSVDILNQALGARARRVTRYISIPTDDPAVEEVSIVVSRISSDDSAEVVQALKALPCVREVIEPAS
jgi:putative Mg2+ transporter-C (MgtC) family protein